MSISSRLHLGLAMDSLVAGGGGGGGLVPGHVMHHHHSNYEVSRTLHSPCLDRGSVKPPLPSSLPIPIPRVTVSPVGDRPFRRYASRPMGLDNGSSPAQSPRDIASMVRPSPVGALRRESFLYRSDSDFDVSPKSLSRASSLTANDACIDDMIVTPFAQILHCLRHIWSNYLLLTNIHPSKSRRALSKDKDHISSINQINNLSDDQRQQLATETLEELEWCLDQLEATQTDRSVSDLATNKFKRMLSRELTQFAEASKSGNQISEYICHTFLEKEQEIDLPVFRVDHVDSAPTPASHSGERSPRPGGGRSSSRSPCRPVNAADRPPPTPTSSASRLVGSSTAGGRRHQRLTNGSCSPHVGGPLPKYGVPTTDEEAMRMHMDGLNIWGIDVFHIAELTNNRPLCAMTYTILQERGLLKALRISPRTLINYISLIEDHYRPDVSYHNSIHAADVTQTSHVMLLAPALESVFTDLETLAVIFACAVHDVDHPGVSNQFLVQSGSELALIYNDESVLENHHLAVAFALLQREGCDLLGEAPRKQRQLFRRIVIDMVLATDMSRHMDHLAHLKTMVETRKISGNCEINMENYNERIQVLQNLIHCADLSNPAKPLDLYRQWTDRITQEFFRQGDLERQLGIDISPMCDRQTASIDKTQVGFIDYIVQPLWETWSELVYPDCQDVLDALERNRSWYHEQIAASPPPTDVDSGHEGDGIDDDRGPDPLQVPSPPDRVGYLRTSCSRPITATPAAGR